MGGEARRDHAIAVASSIAMAIAMTSAGRPPSAERAGATRGTRPQPAPPPNEEPPESATAPRESAPTSGPGFPASGPWVSFYGNAAEMGDLTKVARTYRIINIDADPAAGNFSAAQLDTLKAGG